jgi:nucleoside 2-deoxyribosyltransferase
MVKQRVYLAGPMSGHDDFNFPAFKKAAADLRDLGHYVFNPAEHDELVYGFDIEDIRAQATYRDCLRVDLNWILDHATALAVLPGWEKSSGTAVELALAKALKLPVIYL